MAGVGRVVLGEDKVRGAGTEMLFAEKREKNAQGSTLGTGTIGTAASLEISVS